MKKFCNSINIESDKIKVSLIQEDLLLDNGESEICITMEQVPMVILWLKQALKESKNYGKKVLNNNAS